MRSDEDAILMAIAAIEESGGDAPVLIRDPLPMDNRANFYAVPDDHDPNSRFKISALRRGIETNFVPVGFDRQEMQYYTYAQGAVVPFEMAKFMSDEAKKEWMTWREKVRLRMSKQIDMLSAALSMSSCLEEDSPIVDTDSFVR